MSQGFGELIGLFFLNIIIKPIGYLLYYIIIVPLQFIFYSPTISPGIRQLISIIIVLGLAGTIFWALLVGKNMLIQLLLFALFCGSIVLAINISHYNSNLEINAKKAMYVPEINTTTNLSSSEARKSSIFTTTNLSSSKPRESSTSKLVPIANSVRQTSTGSSSERNKIRIKYDSL